MFKRNLTIITLLAFFAFASKAYAVPDGTGNDIFTGNVGIGTLMPGGALSVMNGNVGIGTWNPQALLSVSTLAGGPSFLLSAASNSVYIQNDLEVDGTAYLVDATIGTLTTSIGLTATGGSTFDHIEVTGESVFNTLSGNVGIGTTMTGASATTKFQVNPISNSPFTVSSTGNVGIGTNADQAALSVMNGNVGIGTWTAGNNLSVIGGVGIGSATYASTAAPANGLIVQGNVGIATTTPQGILAIPYGVGNVGIGTISPSSLLQVNAISNSPFTVSSTGNVGLGTNVNQTALSVMNGNVGIGTWTASSALQVVGNVGIGTSVPSSGLSVGTNGVSIGVNYTNGTSAPSNGLIVQGNVGIGTTIPGGALSVMTGNVGIGTWNPQALLSVSTLAGGPSFLLSAASNSVYIQNDLEVDGTAYLVDATIGTLTTSLGITSVGGSTFDHIEVTGESVFNTLSGNVGIGTTMTGASAGTKFAVLGGNVGIGTTSAQGILAIPYGVGNVGIGTIAPSSEFQVNPISNSPFTVSSTGNVGVGTNANQAALSVMNGNVGIGTWTAGNNLSVIGGVGIGSATYASTAAPANGLIVQGNVGISTTSPGSNLSVLGGVTVGTYAVNAAPIGGMLISGNVAIGTSTPQTGTALTVLNNTGFGIYGTGSLGIQGFSTSANGVGVWGQGATSTTFNNNGVGVVGTGGSNGIGVQGTSTGGIGGYFFSSSGNALITGLGNVGIGTSTPGGGLAVMNGNVGIGTWNPQALLSVSTVTGGPSFLLSAASNSVYIQNDLEVDGTAYLVDATIGNLTTSLGITSVGGSTFDHIEVTGESVFNTLSGNVGIGTTMTGASATTKLAVLGGNVGIGTTSPQGILAIPYGVGNVGIGTIAPSSEFQINPISNSPFTVSSMGNVGIGTNANQAALSVMNGNVGIGTWAPASALEVNGNIGISAGVNGVIQVNGLLGGANLTIQAEANGLTSSGGNLYLFGGAAGIGGNTIIAGGAGSPTNGNTILADSGTGILGNVGIGTITPMGILQINTPTSSPFIVTTAGNVGIGTTTPMGGLAVMNGNVGIGTWAPVKPLSVTGDAYHNGNIGIGTTFTSAGAALTVMNGNVGIGTWAPSSSLIVIGGNVGIGSAVPYGSMDVGPTGTICFGSACKTSWADSNNYWTLSAGAGNVGVSTTNTVGIGTTSAGVGAALVVMNGNVGIGTWAPVSSMEVVGVGTLIPGSGLIVMSGNVGIGTAATASALTLPLGTTAGQGINFGGDTTIGIYRSAAGIITLGSGVTVDQFATVTAGNFYTTYVNVQSGVEVGNTVGYNFGNAGSGASTVDTGISRLAAGQIGVGNGTFGTYANSLVAGNIGIGTFNVAGGRLIVETGNVGIGTTIPGGALSVMSGNVGIGTWNPQALLAVSTVTGGPSFLLSAASNSVYIQNDLEVDGTAYLVDATIGTLTTSIGITATGGSTFDHIEVTGESVFNTLSGNVGIGTTMTGASANTKLAVIGGNVGIGTTSAQGILAIPYGVGNVGIGTIAPSSEFQINPISNSPFTVSSTGNVGIGTNANQAALSVMNGNVGIGTWSPASALEVNGNIDLSAGTNRIIQVNANSSNGANLTVQAAAATSSKYGGNLYLFGGAGGGASPIGGNTIIAGGTGAIVGGDTILADSGTGIQGNVGIGTITPMGILQINSPTTSPFIVTTVGNVGIGTTTPMGGLSVMNGNVGIGTWAPQALLAVSTLPGGPSFLLSAASNSVYIQNDLEVDGTAYLVDATIGNLTTSLGITSVGGSTFDHIEVTGESVFNTLSGNVGIGTTMTGASATTKLAVLGGNVGIGTTSPQGILAIPYGVGNVGIGTIAPSSEFQINPISNSPFTVSSTGNVGIGTNANQAALSVMNGNVGIGTWAPVKPLSVTGDAYHNGNIGIGTTFTSAGAALTVMNGNVGIGTWAPSSSLIVIGGNVGIGSAVPYGSLDVGPTGSICFGSACKTSWANSGNFWTLTVGAGNVGISTTNTVGIGTTSAGVGAGLVVMNGNVGIGTWAPSDMFQVGQFSSSSSGFEVDSNGNLGIGTILTSTAAISVMNGNVGIGTWVPNSEVVVKAPGSQSSILQVSDAFGTYFTVSGYNGSGGIITPGIAGSGGGNTLNIWNGASSGSAGTHFFHQSNNDSYAAGTGQLVLLSGWSGYGQFNPTSGNGIYNMLEVDSNINQTGTATGITRGIFINPNNVAAYDYRSLEVSTGNVGIGTISGNLGIGSQWPGQRLDVQGNIRDTGEIVNGNVGIGTSFTSGGAALTVMNGNVGIGTWAPQALLSVSTVTGGPSFLLSAASNSVYIQNDLEVDGTAYLVDATIGTLTTSIGITATGGSTFDHIEVTGESVFNTLSGNVGIGTTMTGASATTKLAVLGGNVGIGTTTPQGILAIPYGVGNVGIGTISPSSEFQINPISNSPFTVSSTGNVGLGTNANQAALTVMNGNVGIGTWAPVKLFSVTGDAYHNGNIGIGTTFTSAGAALTVMNGNVGIGTWVPAYALNVNGTLGVAANSSYTISTAAGFVFQNSTAPAYEMYGGYDTTIDAAFLQGVESGVIIKPFVINPRGANVGIGTWAPLKPLSVSGDSYFSGNMGIGTTFIGGTGEAALSVMNGNVGIGTWAPSSSLIVIGGNVGIGSAVPYGSLDVGPTGTICFGSSCKTSWGNSGNYWTLSLGAGNVGISTTNSVGIGTSSAGAGAGLVVMNGNVGIGTWAPSDIFQVGKFTSSSSGFEVDSNGNVGIGTILTSTAAISVMSGNVGIGTWAPVSALEVNGGIQVDGAGSSSISGGNVGIGSTVPNYKLDVEGGYVNASSGLCINGSCAANWNAVFPTGTTGQTLYNSSGTWTVTSTLYNNGTNVGIGTTTPMGGLAVMNGNVGIGTWAPQALLSVSTVTGGPSFLLSAASNSVYIQNDLEVDGTAYLVDATIGTLTTSIGITATGGSTFDHIEVTGESVFNTLSGNVGIGTTMTGASASTKFQVNPINNSPFTVSSTGNVGLGTNANQAALSVMNGNVGIGTWAPSDLLQVGRFISSSSGFEVDSNGNVGIGTTTTGRASLSVMNGNVGIGTWKPAAALDVGTGKITGSFDGSSTNRNYINVGGGIDGGFPAVDMIFPGGQDTAGFGLIGGLFRSAQVSVAGTNDIFFQAAPLTTAGYGYLESWNAAGMIVGTGANPESAAGPVIFKPGRSEAARINIGGNIGIGTTTPMGGLAVMNGNVGIGTWAPQALLSVSTVTGGPSFLLSAASNSVYIQNDLEVDGTAYLVDATIGTLTTSIGITATGGSTFDHIEVTGESVFNTLSGNVGIGTTMTGASTGTKFALLGGNVGIGTTAPGSTLSVLGGVGIGTYAVNAVSGGALITSGNIGVGTTNTSYANLTVGAPAYNATAWSANPGVLAQFTNNIAGQSQVIIDNKSADTAASDQLIFNNSAVPGSSNAIIVLNGANYVGTGSLYQANAFYMYTNMGDLGFGTIASHSIHFVIGNPSVAPDAMIISSSGNVGIGTPNPASGLTVMGNVGIGTLGSPYVNTTAPANGMMVQGNVGIGTFSNIKGQLIVYGGNVGIGTTAPMGALSVMNGNVGIGTWAPSSSLIVIGGNVGIGSAVPYGSLDVGPTGNICFGSSCKTSWANSGNYWTLTAAGAGNVGISTTNSVGIGTSSAGAGTGLVVMNGNVGIGTWAPSSSLIVIGGNVGIGTALPFSTMEVVGIGTLITGSGLSVMNGNVGIGTSIPAALLDVNGNTILGKIFNSTGSISVDGGAGSLAGGYAVSGNVGTYGNITSSGTATLAFGYAQGGPTVNGSIISSGTGSIAMGSAWAHNGGPGILQSTGAGSIAMGYAYEGTLQATGTGSVAIGENAQATAANALAFGNGVINNNASTFMVGFNANPTLTVTSANVGIGTITPGNLLSINGAVGIGTANSSYVNSYVAPSGGMIVQGNVGIGTALPSSGLSVGSNGVSIGANYTNGISAPTNGLLVQGNVGIGTSTPQGAFVVTNGNVGIGTWAPNGALIVSGNVGIGTTIASSVFVARSSGPVASSSNNFFVVDGQSFAGTGAAPYGGSILINAGSVTGVSGTGGGNVTINAGNAAGIGEPAGNIILNPGAIGSSPYVLLAPTGGSNVGIGTSTPGGGLIVMNGNVGIGTISPTQALQVEGSVMAVEFYDAAGILVDNSGNIHAPGEIVDSQGSNGAIGNCLTVAAGNQVVWAPCSGNVGAGTTSPSLPLNSVQYNDNNSFGGSANFVFTGTSVGIGTFQTKNTLDVANNVSIGAAYAGLQSAAPNGLIVQGNVGIGTSKFNGGLSVMTGNVGIGTWNPPALLAVVSTIPGGPSFLGSAAPQSVFFQDDLEVDGTAYLVDATIGTLTTSTGITSIGGSTFDHIEVTGESVFNTLSGNVGIGTTMTGASANTKFQVNPVGNSPFTVSTTGNVGLGTNANQTALSVMNGNVGIGTWAPQALLSVSTLPGGPSFLLTAASNSAYIQNDLEVDGTAYLVDATIGTLTTSTGITSTGGSTFDHIEVTGESVFNTLSGNVGIGTTMTGASANTKFQVNPVGSSPFTVSTTGNVGLGTNANQAALSVMNGNVGIGTWVTAGALDIKTGNNVLVESGNVGIGTKTPMGALAVMNGNVGIGTWAPVLPLSVTGDTYHNGNVGIGTSVTTAGAALSVMNGNVGIGTWAPIVPVQVVGIGTLTANGGGLIVTNGNVGIGLTNATEPLSIAGMVNVQSGNAPLSAGPTGLTMGNYSSNYGWIQEYQSNPLILNPVGNNVGIGTTTPMAGLAVMNGNVGIGTWAPSDMLQVGRFISSSSGFEVDSNGNVGIGTTTTGRASLSVMNGNVGIGTWAPSSSLIVIGGNVGIGSAVPYGSLDVGPTGTLCFGSSCKTSWANSGNFWTLTYAAGNVGISTTNTVGIGTSSAGAGAGLVVMNGNVGIGTWAPAGLLQVNNSSNSPFMIGAGGNVGIGTTTPMGGLTVMNGNVGIGTWAPGNLLTVGATMPNDTTSTAHFSGPVGVWTGTMNGWPNTRTTLSLGVAAATDNYFSMGIQGNDTAGIGISSTGSNMMFVNQNGPIQFKTGVTYNADWNTTGTVNLDFATNGNVGIGTTTPMGALTVMSGNVGIGTWAPAGLLQINNQANTPFLVDASGRVGIGTATPQGLLAIPYGVGNVGIGTIAPASEFQVNPISISPFTVSSTGNVGIGTIANQAALSVMNGNVGIGTWAPVKLFSVTGDAYHNGNIGIGTTFTSGGAALTVMNGNVGIGTWAPSSSLIVIGGNVGIGSAVPYGSLDVGPTGNICFGSSCKTSWANSGNFWTLTSAAGNVGVSTTNTLGIGTTSAGAGAGLVVMNGNVGIGTWAPAGLLQVNNSSNSPFMIDTGGNVGIGTTITTAGAALSVMNGNVGIGTWVTAGALDIKTGNNVLVESGNVGIGTKTPMGALAVMSGNVGIGTWAPAGLLQINNQANTPFLVDASGRVGIGTATPQGLLAIPYGVGNVGIGTIAPSSEFQVNPTSISPFTVSSTGNVGVGTNANQTALSVMNGNVGIGTWAPSSSLIVIGGNVGIGSAVPYGSLDVGPTGNICFGSSCKTSWASAGTNYWSLTSAAGNVGVSTTNTVGIGTSSAGAGAGLVVMNGNVGIGTWAPQGALDIKTGNNVLVESGNVGIGTTTPQGLFVIPYGVGNVGIGTIAPSSELQVNPISNSPFTVSSTGNVGIGTNANQAALSVMSGNVGIGTWAPSSTLVFQGSLSGAYTPVTSSPTLDNTYYLVNVDATAAVRTITLPTAVGIGGRCYRIKDWKGQASVHNITIATTSSQTIDGVTSLIMTNNYDAYDICSDGANWALY